MNATDPAAPASSAIKAVTCTPPGKASSFRIIGSQKTTPPSIGMAVRLYDGLSIMPDPTFPLPARLSRAEHVFPTLTPEQIARISPHGRVRPTRTGEVLVNAGDQVAPFFVVTAGQIEIMR